MNEYNSIFFMYQCAHFFNALLTKKARTLLRAGQDAGISGQASALDKAVAFWQQLFCFFSSKRRFLFNIYYNFFLSFKVSMKDGGGVKNFARFSSFFAKFPLKFMPLSSRLQLFHQFLVRPQTGTPTAGHQLQPKCPVGNST